MPDTQTILLVTLAGLALSITPGPSMLYVLSRSIGQSREAGLASAVGLALGGVALALAAALGLAVLFSNSSLLYTTVLYLGAGYLVYLGVGMLWPSGEDGATRIDQVRRQSIRTIVVQGIVVEMLNPKTLLFFVAFLPQFIDTDKGNVTLQMLILGAIVPLTALPSDLVVSFAGGAVTRRLAGKPRMVLLLQWLGGLFLIGLGIRTLVG